MQNCQISLRVGKKVPYNENMAHTFVIDVLGERYSVTCSNKRNRSVTAYVVPDNITVYQQMSKKEQKMVQREARTRIQESL